MTSDNKVAVITGAGGYIGAEIARDLAKRSFSLALVDIDVAGLEATSATCESAEIFPTDICDTLAVTRLVADLIKRFGALDVLVNAAGVEGPMGPVESLEPADVRHVFDVNVMGMFWLCGHVVPIMKRCGTGRIINMASGAGLAGGENASAYHASKHAVVGLTRSLAKELAPHGLPVNAVCPGYVESPMIDRILSAQRSLNAAMTPAVDAVPMGRMCAADEVAETVGYLASDAPQYMTGSCLVIDGALRA